MFGENEKTRSVDKCRASSQRFLFTDSTGQSRVIIKINVERTRENGNMKKNVMESFENVCWECRWHQRKTWNVECGT